VCSCFIVTVKCCRKVLLTVYESKNRICDDAIVKESPFNAYSRFVELLIKTLNCLGRVALIDMSVFFHSLDPHFQCGDRRFHPLLSENFPEKSGIDSFTNTGFFFSGRQSRLPELKVTDFMNDAFRHNKRSYIVIHDDDLCIRAVSERESLRRCSIPPFA